MIFLVLVLTILTFVVLWNMDLGNVVHLRIRSQNGADAAALAAAAWQGRSLNAVGELNLLLATTKILTEIPPGLDDGASAQAVREAITETQARILLLGPLVALEAAQQAARNNGIRNDGSASHALVEHADLVREQYPEWLPAGMAGFDDWVEVYAEALEAIARQGVAAGPRNSRFFRDALIFSDPAAERYLASQGFYYAVAARDWCYLEDLLYSGYADFTFWGDAWLDESVEPGSELLPLGVRFALFEDAVDTLSAADSRRLVSLASREIRDRGTGVPATFPQFQTAFECAVYARDGARDRWREWGPTHPNPVGNAGLVAPVRAEYDYAGCDAVFEVNASPETSLRGRTDARAVGWIPAPFRGDVRDSLGSLEEFSEGADVMASAAAKPIGSLDVPGGTPRPPHAFGIVLPAFERVALIPIAYASEGYALNAAWREHVVEHLAAYLATGGAGLDSGCWYCRQLATWDDPAFRQEGRAWHEAVDPWTGEKLHNCPPPAGGPGEGYGGFPIVH